MTASIHSLKISKQFVTKMVEASYPPNRYILFEWFSMPKSGGCSQSPCSSVAKRLHDTRFMIIKKWASGNNNKSFIFFNDIYNLHCLNLKFALNLNWDIILVLLDNCSNFFHQDLLLTSAFFQKLIIINPTFKIFGFKKFLHRPNHSGWHIPTAFDEYSWMLFWQMIFLLWDLFLQI